jgi:hypothetical protein
MSNILDHGTPFNETATGATTAYAYVTCAPNTVYIVSDLSGYSSGTAGTSTLYATSIGGTVTALWNAAGISYDNHFLTPIRIPAGSASFGYFMNGTTSTQANLIGVSIQTK